MSGQVHQNVDAVMADCVRNFFVAHRNRVAPDIHMAAKPMSDCIGRGHIAVAENFKTVAVMVRKKRNGEHRLAVLSKIGGHISDPKPSAGERGIIVLAPF